MTVPAQNLVSALAIVNAGVVPTYLGPGNQGFLPFGPDDASHSHRVSAGNYKMRLVQKVDFQGGEGKIACGSHLATVTVPAPTTTIYWAHDLNEVGLIHVETQIVGVDGDFPFWCEVSRTPQSLT